MELSLSMSKHQENYNGAEYNSCLHLYQNECQSRVNGIFFDHMDYIKVIFSIFLKNYTAQNTILFNVFHKTT